MKDKNQNRLKQFQIWPSLDERPMKYGTQPHIDLPGLACEMSV